MIHKSGAIPDEQDRSGEVSGWHFATREPVLVRWRDGAITQIDAATTKQPPADLWIAPALVDLQINGYGGVDFQQNEMQLPDLLRAVRQLRTAGCTQFLLTLITDEWSRLMTKLRRLKELRSKSDELRRAIAGWHIEGPFLSSEPGFHGAHDPAQMIDPAPAHIHELREATENDPVLLTLAPERSGALEAIALAVSLGMKVSLGHTNASPETLRGAIAAGATGFTHLGNACPQQLDRHDNILWRVMDTPGLTVGLIPDRIHVAPQLFRLVHRVWPTDSIYYTTDAVAAADAPPGRYSIGSVQLEVGADQIVRLPGRSHFAGSALRPIEGVMRAAQMLDRSWQEVWPSFSVRPASFVGLPSGLEVGQPANLCVLTTAADNSVTELRVLSGIGC